VYASTSVETRAPLDRDHRGGSEDIDQQMPVPIRPQMLHGYWLAASTIATDASPERNSAR
jgi:hypothetical protein